MSRLREFANNRIEKWFGNNPVSRLQIRQTLDYLEPKTQNQDLSHNQSGLEGKIAEGIAFWKELFLSEVPNETSGSPMTAGEPLDIIDFTGGNSASR